MIVTLTFNPAVDQTIQFDEPMAPDHVMRASDARFDAGGKGINVAQFLTAMAKPCVATGVVGGFTGTFIRDDMRADGVETAFVEVDGTTRLNTTALADGVEYKLNHDGPTIEESDLDAVVERVREQDPDRVLVGGSLPPGLSVADVDTVATAGDWETVVDMEGKALRELDAQYALCKPNREELGEATGDDVSTVEGCARAADSFRSRGFDRVIASLGGDGAVLANGSDLLYAEALDVDVVDTVGAGDALLSGVVAAWEDGEDDATALRNGVAVSSRLVERAGTAVPSFDDIEALRERVTVREL
ncbi:1-phosphofructokinase [Haloarcula nitratireducens]|uniref:1-phosphofructokinase family hexose kinase n=1 Tax=Haloarcula nitratireducens TaxID=2487749 RepID=A0AAW4P908_9EURY|nr:1-phosphofructokinase [Halomicroarcula nitratireducens]MBX0294422.1 1-phosphofructokinase family hexose kinase [Halomicroarcula nitratireducens]